QPALEPEEILQNVECRIPLGLIVHELDTALHDVDLLRNHRGVDDVENIRMDVVFSVEDRHHLVTGRAQSDIQAMRLVDRAITVCDHTYAADTSPAKFLDFLLRLADGPHVVY